MNRALRVILPLFLILVIIFCIVWYLMVYDRGFTQDVLLYQAKLFEDSGNHKLAAWLYDVAYSHSGGSEEVAIELAARYRKAGNYTKAEITLTRAIAEKPSAPLYAALSATYVEQDKLLDAVTMLDTISNPQIKAQLDAMRPKAPTVSAEPGYYTQYITLEFSATGTLYVSADGEYPDTQTDRYTNPITLSGGETILYAIAVDDQGLVSPCGIFGFTVGGIIERVTFTDSAIEAALRQAINAGSTKPIYTNDLWEILEFTVPAEATSYADLAHLTYLTSLTINNTENIDLTVLSKLTMLESLTIQGSPLDETELAAIGALTNLKHLTLDGCNVSTVSALSNLTRLESLDLSNNSIRNITVIATMTGLKSLKLSSNALDDLTALTALTELQVLDLSYNALVTLDPICSLTSLRSLNASYNKLANITGLGNLAQLETLDLSHNSISSVSELAVCIKMEKLNLSNNSLWDIQPLSSLTKLTNLDISYNQITALPKFSADCALVTINGSHNNITAVDSLGKLMQLNNVYLEYNPNLRSLRPLDNCPVLIQVHVFGTKVTDVSFLTKKSVVVRFDPTA